jgi:hypothetical protein
MAEFRAIAQYSSVTRQLAKSKPSENARTSIPTGSSQAMYSEDIETCSKLTQPDQPPESRLRKRLPPSQPANALSRAMTASLWFVIGWALFELPWELLSVDSTQDAAALIGAKLLLAILMFVCSRGYAWARHVLLYVCCLSVVAIAPHLIVEFMVYPIAFVLSTIECIGKVVLAGLLVSRLF